MDANLNQEIILGANVCERLKNIYFKEMNWIDCYRNIAVKFSFLKSISKRFDIDKSNLQVLNELIKYSNQDILDAFEQG